MNSDDKIHAVNECVRFIIFHGGSKAPINAKALKDIAKKHNVKLPSVLQSIKEVLSKTYGYNIVSTDNSSELLLINILENSMNSNVTVSQTGTESDTTNDMNEYDSEIKDSYKILILLVLAHIFMSDNSVTEGNLENFLALFDIHFHERHELFGNVKTFVTNTMVTQKYLSKIGDKNNIQYAWGPRSEAEISKTKILNFIAEVHGNKPEVWPKQYAAATNQFSSNTDNSQENVSQNLEE